MVEFSYGKSIDISLVNSVEDRLGVKFPQGYVDLVLENDGALFSPYWIRAKDGGVWALHSLDAHRGARILKINDPDGAFHVPGLIFFSSGSRFADKRLSCMFAFDYRDDGPPEIPVVIYAYEKSIVDDSPGVTGQVIPVASSFDEFLGGLFDFPEDQKERVSGGKLIDISLVREAEERLGVKFPQSYVDIVLGNDGGELYRHIVDVVDPAFQKVEEFSLSSFVSFSRGDMVSMNIRDEVPVIPSGVIAFGETSWGDFFAFDYRVENSSEPPVVVYFHENPVGKNIVFIASSFDEFVAMLKPDKFRIWTALKPGALSTV